MTWKSRLVDSVAFFHYSGILSNSKVKASGIWNIDVIHFYFRGRHDKPSPSIYAHFYLLLFLRRWKKQHFYVNFCFIQWFFRKSLYVNKLNKLDQYKVGGNNTA